MDLGSLEPLQPFDNGAVARDRAMRDPSGAGVRLLDARLVAKPWGRHQLLPGIAGPASDAPPVGEMWFEDAAQPDAALLVKYLFTNERLSVQVHPDDAAARAAGETGGKDEAWLILAAAPGASIALGPKHAMSSAQLRAAAIDGTIEDLLDWRPVSAGDFLYAPAGTVHAIGGGVTLIEIQQNNDVTYRLYDYGRPRALHLDEAVAVASTEPFAPQPAPRECAPGRTLLAQGPKLVVERWQGGTHTLTAPPGDGAWLVPVGGCGVAGDVAWHPGQCLRLSGAVTVVASDDADLLIAYPGAEVMPVR